MVLFIIGTMKDFLIQDQMWCSSLDDTKWLLLVAHCLSAANTVAEEICNERRRNIVIKGKFTLIQTRVVLTFTTLWANSADDKLMIIFLYR